MEVLGEVKRGDTFAFYANITDDLGQAVIGAAAKIKSQIRDRYDKLCADLAVSETATPGQYLLRAADTSEWKPGVLYLDIQYTDNDVTTSSDTLSLQVVKDVTQ